ncbi:32826_t:CDS:1, partial [Racocetra persica]
IEFWELKSGPPLLSDSQNRVEIIKISQEKREKMKLGIPIDYAKSISGFGL